MNKIRPRGFLQWTAIALLSMATTSAQAEKLVEINRVVAQVDDKVITQGELDRVLELLKLSEQEKKDRAREFIENKIENMLVIREFKSEGRFIPGSYIESEFNKRLIRDFDNNRVLFRDFLKRKAQTQLDFRDDIEKDIIIGAMYAKFRRGQADVSPDRVEEFYNDNKALFTVDAKVRPREIKLSPVAGEPRDVLVQQANDLYEKLKKGAAFEKLAIENGQSPLKSLGGDWGTLVAKKEIANQALADKAFSLKQGEFSEPFVVEEMKRDTEGNLRKTGKVAVYILKAEIKQEAGVKALKDVREEVEKKLAQELDRHARTRWVARLRRKAYVKYFNLED